MSDLDLQFELSTQLSLDVVWDGWTKPEIFKQWFCPAPWKITECTIDLKPGGIFRTVMREPEGAECRSTSSYLVVEPKKKIVWTNALLPDLRPADVSQLSEGDFLLTIQLAFKADQNGTVLHALAQHSRKQDVVNHQEMGLEEGWTAALLRLEGLYKK